MANKGSSLAINQSLSIGDFLVSPNGNYRAIMQADGNFVVYQGTGGHAIWASGVVPGIGIGSYAAIMQADGNFVVYLRRGTGRRAIWASGVVPGVGNGPYTAIMQDDGNFVVYRGTGGHAIWASKGSTAIRRNVATISPEERNRLRDAIITLNHKSYPGQRNDLVRDANGKIVHGAGGVTYWFKQDEIHQATHVHGGPAFLTWHREICNRFEALLREVDPQVSLHYWDWTTDPGGLFTSDFMGTAQGPAGEPWLSAGFYNPTANPFRAEFDFSKTDNPFDPPRKLERGVTGGIPNLGVPDAQILAAETFPDMRQLLETAHNAAHVYIGGTLGDPHKSFRDPFVFLLHSNVDRLFALWQLQPGKAWRLDPEQVYGSESDTAANGPDVGILTPFEPWAGVNAPGAEAGIQPARPWADPENEQLLPQNQKNSKDPAVVAPPHYDTNP